MIGARPAVLRPSIQERVPGIAIEAAGLAAETVAREEIGPMPNFGNDRLGQTLLDLARRDEALRLVAKSTTAGAPAPASNDAGAGDKPEVRRRLRGVNFLRRKASDDV